MAATTNSVQHQGELKRRIAGCRERLRRTRTTQRIEERATVSTTRPRALELSEAFVCDAPEDDEGRAAATVTDAPADSFVREGDSSAEEGAEFELLLLACGAEKEAEA